MYKLLIVIAALLSGFGGYQLGGRSGRDARAALDEQVAKTRLVKDEAEKAQAALNQRIASLTADFDTQSKQLQTAQAQQEKQVDTIIDQRPQRIAVLEQARTGLQAQISELKAQLAAARTPKEREVLQSSIAQVEQQDKVASVELDGRKCQAVPVPADLLVAWRGAQP